VDVATLMPLRLSRAHSLVGLRADVLATVCFALRTDDCDNPPIAEKDAPHANR